MCTWKFTNNSFTVTLTPSMSENCFWRPSSLLAWSSTTLSTDDITFARSSPSVLSFSPSPDYSAHAHIHTHTHMHTRTHHVIVNARPDVKPSMRELLESQAVQWLVGWLVGVQHPFSAKIWLYQRRKQFSELIQAKSTTKGRNWSTEENLLDEKYENKSDLL